MPAPVMIAPSLQCADPLFLGDAVRILERAGADMLHVDLMDHHFVPNLALSFDAVKALRAFTPLELDVHIMAEPVGVAVRETLAAGAHRVCFHVENKGDAGALLREIRQAGRLCGLAISPDTPISALFPYLAAVDYVLLMAVRPGFAGQKFLPDALERAASLAGYRKEQGLSFAIEVDGGIDEVNGRQCILHGADILVAGAKCIFLPGGDLAELTRAFAQAMKAVH